MAKINVSIDSSAAEAGAARVNRALDTMRTGADRTLGVFRQMGDRLRGTFDRLRGMIFSLQGAFATIGIGLTARAFIDAASTSEQYRVRLERLLGSVAEGNRMFQEMAAFAAQSTFEFEEIMGAATALSGVMAGGVDEVKQYMPIIADLAAVTGLGIQDATGQVIRMFSAGASAADMFRERGILAMLGFQAGVTYSAEETRKKLIEAYEDPFSKFRGASLALATTWQGVTGMLADLWFAFRNKVMEGGLFDYLKALATVIKDRLAGALEGGDEAYTRFADRVIEIFEKIIMGTAKIIDQLEQPFNRIKAIAKEMADSYSDLPATVREIGLLGAIAFGAKGFVILGAGLMLYDGLLERVRALRDLAKGDSSVGEFALRFSGADELLGTLDKFVASARDFWAGETAQPIMLDEIIVYPEDSAQGKGAAFLSEVQTSLAVIRAGGDDSAQALQGAQAAAKLLANEIARGKQEAEALAENADDIQAIMDRLDPLAARMKQFERDKALLGQGFMTVAPGLETRGDYDAAYGHLIAERDADLKSMEASANAAGDAIDDLGDRSVTALEDIRGATQDWGAEFNETLTQSLMGAKINVSEILRAIEADIIRMTLRQNVTQPLMQFINAGINSYFAQSGATVPVGASDSGLYASLPPDNYHRGGIVGGVDPLPRYHKGLMPDEQLAVLQKGEGVFTKGQMRALGGPQAAAPVTVNVYPQAGEQARVEQSQGADGQTQIEIMMEQIESRMGGNIRKGGGISQAIEGTYGLNRGRGAVA